MLKNKRIVVTGATGFIGANIIRHFLKLGAKVSAFFLSGDDKWRIKDISKDISEYPINLLERAELEDAISQIKPQIIFHTAVYGGHVFQKDTDRIMKTNFLGTVNLLKACSNTDFELFVNTGSSSEYGIKSHPIKEDDLPKPTTSYGVSKLTATLYCQAVARSENKPIVTLRLFSPYGYYDEPTRLISSVIISCLEGKNPEVSAPDYVRDFVFIEDVIDAYIKVIENKDRIGGEVLNIGSGRQYSVAEVAGEIIKFTNNAFKPQWGKEPKHHSEPKIWQADISKAQKFLNWKPKYDFGKGLKKTIDWFQENSSLYEKESVSKKDKL